MTIVLFIDVEQLPIPKVIEALMNTILYPMNALNGCTVQVEYLGMTSDHEIQPFWQGPPEVEPPMIEVKCGNDEGWAGSPIPSSQFSLYAFAGELRVS
ncbi:hypothetical protein [Photorhabdus temperata]|uniref:Uncharacterized protein n=1 Tax=Photorhabdus temperata J3 TaxID=1389415 RepID=U7R1Z7_PHOTE|nr:hypothetical protein [Photorhabdus temperata]ERT13600.1 hypothetical protein O185_07940 [Photorhabdus temperata J3]